MSGQTINQQIRIGDIAPNFQAQSTAGDLDFYKWVGDSWCVLFSHPKDFTPVCTTELGLVAKLKSEFDRRNVKPLGISVGDVECHLKWTKDIDDTQHTHVNYPIIGDPKHEIVEMYGMIHPNASDTFTVRSVFIIDPTKKVRLILTYPASTGRNFQEILRVIDALQLTDKYSVSTPANWTWGEDVVISPAITDPAILKEKFPKGWKELRPYLRMTPQPNL